VKLDEIGDYILFRNFLKVIRECDAYKGFRVTLLGNNVWKEITEIFDKNVIDEIIWLDKKKFNKNIFYRRSFLKELNKKKFHIAINFHISRNFYLDDVMMKVVNAKNKIGHKTDLANLFDWQRRISDKYYSDLVDIPGVSFEFTKNKIYLENLISEKIELTVPQLEIKEIKSLSTQKSNNVIFFIGSKRRYLRWSVNNFVREAEKIITQYRLNIVLIGSTSDMPFTKEFKSLINKSLLYKVIDLTAKTSLIEAITQITKGQLTISNDSGMAHISAALGIPTIVILNGSRFGRFFPYPENDYKKIIPIYPPNLENYRKNFDNFVQEYRYKSNLEINSITFERVSIEIDNIFLNN
jgi:ADP-heptose:LPS heptosyltransferase